LILALTYLLDKQAIDESGAIATPPPASEDLCDARFDDSFELQEHRSSSIKL
jgi:hypothetical protein